MLMMEDRVLRDRFRAGERDAMTTVFNHYSPALAQRLTAGFSFKSGDKLLRFGGLNRRHELHDVIGETFRRAFEEKARLAYTGLAPYSSYLLAIARNYLLKQLRIKFGSDWLELSDEVYPEGDDRSASPEHALQTAELSSIIKAFLADLPVTDRRFISLRFDQRLSQEQVARKLSTSRRRVRETEKGLRSRLVSLLDHCGYLTSRGGS